MGWSIGYDEFWKRDIGYGVPATCDHPECDQRIDRGLAYVCGHQHPYGGEEGCGLYFCHAHGGGSLCAHCSNETGEAFPAKPDVVEWINHKLAHPSWQAWRDGNPGDVARLTALVQEANDAGLR